MEDSFGRTVLFHGVNIVVKVPPYLPESETFDFDESLTDQDIENLVDWGFNLVRLGVMWEAVEPLPGYYNYTYLKHVNQTIKKLGENGIRVIVDGH